MFYSSETYDSSSPYNYLNLALIFKLAGKDWEGAHIDYMNRIRSSNSAYVKWNFYDEDFYFKISN